MREHTDPPIPSSPGTYALVLWVPTRRAVRIGALGRFDFHPGHHIYIGSALGPGGLRSRIAHHLAPSTRPHWHVDYLLDVGQVRQVWYTCSDHRHECVWAACMHCARAASVAIAGFGASDCHCASHLFVFAAAPSIAAFRRRLHTQQPRHEAITCSRVNV